MKAKVERAYVDHQIALSHIDAEAKEAATEAEFQAVEAKKAEAKAELDATGALRSSTTRSTTSPRPSSSARRPRRPRSRPTRRWTPPATTCAGSRGPSRCSSWPTATGTSRSPTSTTTPRTTCSTEITGITEEDFRKLRDGREVTDPTTGEVTTVPGLFDEAVFNQAIQEFLNKKDELADYFDPALTEDIFAYIPQQKTSLVFTPKPVVR